MSSERAAFEAPCLPAVGCAAGEEGTRAPFDALAALRDSEARFRSLCELSSDWYWEQDASFRFTVMSGGVTNKGNFSVSKAIGKRRWELPILLEESEWAAHRATLEAHLPFTDFEYRIVTEDGSLRYYSARGEPLFNDKGEFTGYRGIANDITRRKQSDEALRRFRAALDTSADSILLIDRAAMRLIDANTTTCEVLGYSRQEVLAMGPQDIFPGARGQLERAYDELIAGAAGAAQSQTTLRHRDGGLLPVEVSWRAIMSDDGWNIVGIARDIRARLAAEQTIQRHAMQQQSLNEQLEERVRERTRELQEAQAELLSAAHLAGMAEIATNVLHNVGNVLNSVNVSAGIVSERLRSSKLKGLVRAVHMMDEHAGDLGGFLTLDAKGKLLPGYLRELAPALQAEQAAMAEELATLGKSIDHIKEVVATQQSYAGAARMLESVRLDELLDDALRMNDGGLTRHKVDVVRQLAELPAMQLDRNRVLQILVNLISNAKEALSDVVDRNPCITLGAALADAADGRVLRVTVADNGVGIAPENLIRIFAHGFTTRKNGHGFGLHSCVLAAQEMGGNLKVHSDGCGQGATLTLEIPVDLPTGKP
ncbi:MAG TPA: PAS domain S-box protein [Burkholderiaceae bacterium]|nr:PAS domain S-box protein [Burkholderiaceae bacterium]